MNKQHVWNSRSWMQCKRNLIGGRYALVYSNLNNLIQHNKESEFMELTDEEIKYLRRAMKALNHLIKIKEKSTSIVLDKFNKV